MSNGTRNAKWKVRGSFLLSAALSAVATFAVSGCPEQLGCPNCGFRTATFTVTSPGRGYTVSEATLVSDFTFDGHCPLDEKKKSCTDKQSESLGSIPVDTAVTERLVHEMGDDDTVVLSVDVVLVADGMPPIVVTIPNSEIALGKVAQN